MEVFQMPAVTSTAAHEAPPTQQLLPGLADHSAEFRETHPRRHHPARPAPPPTDDEILGLDTTPPRSPDPAQAAFDFDAPPADVWRDANSSASPDQHRHSACPACPDAGRDEGRERSVPSSSLREAPGHAREGLSGRRLVEPGRSEEPLFDAANTSAPTTPLASNRPDASPSAEPASFRGIFEANPELRQAWQDAQQYRETFPTPEAARAATAQLADLDRMDALFFSRRPEDHAELARVVASLDPEAFASLAQAITALGTPISGSAPSVGAQHAAPAADAGRGVRHLPSPNGRHSERSVPSSSLREAPGHAVEESLLDVTPANQSTTPGRSDEPSPQRQSTAPTAVQSEFFHATNAAAVEGVLDAIESQVERLLPEGVSKSARNRVVGEIYRELDTTLRSNRQLGQQMRDAFRLALSEANVHGAPNPDHQRAIVSLVTGRARQALPAVAKRVLNEWTSTIVAANNDRRARQHAAERRIDISGASGAANAGRSASPRSVNYARMSDSDILNL